MSDFDSKFADRLKAVTKATLERVPAKEKPVYEALGAQIFRNGVFIGQTTAWTEEESHRHAAFIAKCCNESDEQEGA